MAYNSAYTGPQVDAAVGAVTQKESTWDNKQDKLSGMEGQVVGFNQNGDMAAQDTVDASMLRGGASTILSSADAISISPAFNGLGYAIDRGATANITLDGTAMPVTTDLLRKLFDGLAGTFLRFQEPNTYCGTRINWSADKSYQTGDFVRAYLTGSNYKYFRALQPNTNVQPEGNPTTWEPVSVSDDYNTNNPIDITNMDVVITIENLPTSIRYENGVSLYWRTASQSPDETKIEMQDSADSHWMQVVNDQNVSGAVQQYYTGVRPFTGNVYAIRFTFRNTSESTWTAITQIAITGLVGGIEGTVLNLGGGTLYGNLSMSHHKIINLATPTSGSDSANKSYVDNAVPKDVSELNNDAGYITNETDPTVPAWAKAATKPTYTASEVGAVPTSRTVNGKPLSSNISLTADDVGAANPPALRTATLSASRWSGNSQTVTVQGVKTSGQSVRISPATKTDADNWVAAGVWCSEPTTANQLVFTCDTAPTENININVELQEVQS